MFSAVSSMVRNAALQTLLMNAYNLRIRLSILYIFFRDSLEIGDLADDALSFHHIKKKVVRGG